MNLNPTSIYEKLVEEGEAWADAQEIAELMEETKKTLVAQLAAESGESSIAAKENYAHRHDDYKKHINAMVKARKAANKAKVRYDSARVWADMIRTKNANERAANRYAT